MLLFGLVSVGERIKFDPVRNQKLAPLPFTAAVTVNVVITRDVFPPGGRRRSEPDEAELLRVSRRLVEDAVSRALQQYKQETLQNGGGPKGPGNGEETGATANSTTDHRK